MNHGKNAGINVIKAILWDHDGLLVDTEKLFFETTRSVFAGAGLALSKETWASLYLGEGKTSKEIALSLGGHPDSIPQVINERNDLYRAVLHQPPPFRPLVRETFAALFGSIKMALVTDSHREQLQLIHGRSGFLGLFDTVISGDDSPYPKPHPAPYTAAVKALDVDPEECLAVEDTPKGLASARAAGVPCIAVPNELTRGLEFEGALSVEQDVSGVLKRLRTDPAMGPWL